MMPFVDNKTANALIMGSANALVTGTIDQPIITGRVDAAMASGVQRTATRY
jgi:hypothetical protein